MIRIVLADDQALVRAGFRVILESQPDFEVVGEAADGREVVALCRRLHPDLVLMDIRMPEVDGLEATRRLIRDGASPRILILTTFDLDEYVYEALRAGAAGFLLKTAEPRELIRGVRGAVDGELLLAPSITRRLVETFTSCDRTRELPAGMQELTSREAEVLRLLARGLSNADIADALVLSEATVKTHVNRVLSKLGLSSRVQAVVVAYESGFVVPGQD